MTFLFILATLETALPSLDFPQFPNHKQCLAVVAEVRRDRADIEKVLAHFGVAYDCDGKRWRDVPLFLEPVRLKWVENERILELWEGLASLTDNWDDQSRYPPIVVLDLRDWLERQLGADWFRRGMMPATLSERGEVPRLAPVPTPTLPDS